MLWLRVMHMRHTSHIIHVMCCRDELGHPVDVPGFGLKSSFEYFRHSLQRHSRFACIHLWIHFLKQQSCLLGFLKYTWVYYGGGLWKPLMIII